MTERFVLRCLTRDHATSDSLIEGFWPSQDRGSSTWIWCMHMASVAAQQPTLQWFVDLPDSSSSHLAVQCCSKHLHPHPVIECIQLGYTAGALQILNALATWPQNLMVVLQGLVCSCRLG